MELLCASRKLRLYHDVKNDHERLTALDDNRVATEVYVFQKERENIDRTLKIKIKWLSQPNSGLGVGYAREMY